MHNDTLDDPVGMVHIRDVIGYMVRHAQQGAAKSKRKKRAISVRERAASLLKDRYVAESKNDDLARVLEVELGLATNAKDRRRCHSKRRSYTR